MVENQHPKGRHYLADPKGGMTLRDDTNLVTNVVKDLMKQAMKSVMSGKIGNLMKMRTPAFCHAPLTYLDCMKYEIAYLEEFLILCKENKLMDDPVERLKYISTAQLAGIHSGI